MGAFGFSDNYSWIFYLGKENMKREKGRENN